jgi:LysM repeat protein
MKPPSGLYDCTVEYRVAAGDTLYVIARRYDSAVDAIVKANGIANPGLIVVGQLLVIPVKCAGIQPTSPPPTATSPGAPPQPTAVPCGPTQHIVQPGENLFRIALRYNLTYITLARLNGIVNPNLIRVGQVLTIPSTCAPSPATPVPVQPTPVPPCVAQTYTVRTGDTALRIASTFGVTLTDLVRANNLYNPSLIFIGQRLVIPCR